MMSRRPTFRGSQMLAALSVVFIAASQVNLSAFHDRVVLVSAIPRWVGGTEDPFPTPASVNAQGTLARLLAGPGLSVRVPTKRETPLEEAISLGAAAGATLSLGVRVVPDTTACLAVHAPLEPAQPPCDRPAASSEQLGGTMKDLIAHSRAADGRRLADLIAAVGPPCKGRVDEAAADFLALAPGATVVVEIFGTGGDAEPLLGSIARAVAAFAKETRSHTTLIRPPVVK
jgi:hypothetical protein